MKWILAIVCLLSLNSFAQDFQYYSYPCKPDTSECRGKLVMKHFYQRGDLIRVDDYREPRFVEYIKYGNHKILSSEMSSMNTDTRVNYRYVLEDDILILKFTEDQTAGLFPSRVSYVNDSLGRCVEQVHSYKDSVQFDYRIRIQHMNDSVQLRTILNAELKSVMIEEHQFDSIGLKSITQRRVGETTPFAWIRREE